MKKKFICTVCGYIYEGTEAPEKCPICKAPKSKFQELNDPTEGPAFATVHTLGAARMEGATEEMIKDLETHFHGECAAERGACEDKFRIAKNAKAAGMDATHDTVHEMAKDEARHCAGFMGLYKRYFGE